MFCLYVTQIILYPQLIQHIREIQS